MYTKSPCAVWPRFFWSCINLTSQTFDLFVGLTNIKNLVSNKPLEQYYCKVASTSISRLEAHAGFFRLSMKGKFDVYLLQPFVKKLISII